MPFRVHGIIVKIFIVKFMDIRKIDSFLSKKVSLKGVSSRGSYDVACLAVFIAVWLQCCITKGKVGW